MPPPRRSKLEREFQPTLIEDLESLFPGCIVMKNDSAYIQGIPDLTVLYHSNWALLEVKKSEDEPYQPNQEWYIHWAATHSFGATIYPENKNEVLTALIAFFN